jgi:hypothetical protein
MPNGSEKKEVAIRPPAPETQSLNGKQWRPDQVDPELANLAMAKILVEKMGSPSILNKNFVVRYGIFNAINHTSDNKTGYDASLRLAVYREVAAQSVNIDGVYFEKVWAFLMKPKYIINGMNGMPNQFDQEKGESIVGRFVNWIRGGKKNEQPNNS